MPTDLESKSWKDLQGQSQKPTGFLGLPAIPCPAQCRYTRGMNSTVVLYAGRLSPAVYEPLPDGRDSLAAAVSRARAFPGVSRVVLLAAEDFAAPPSLAGVEVERSARWGKRSVLDRLAALAEGTDLLYFAWADCPLLDPVLAGRIRDRHLRYAAEYSFADGWPYGFAPELLSPGTPAALAYLAGDDQGPIERDFLFSVVQKDINSFDIETEISPVDLRLHRLTLAADSKRNLHILSNLMSAGLSSADDADRVLAERPDLLRGLPAFYSVQVAGGCPQACWLCPYPRVGGVDRERGILDRRDELEPAVFERFLDEAAAFSGDAVIDISLWGECALHSRVEDLVRAVLDRPALSLIVETSGIGWRPGIAERLAEAASVAPPRVSGAAPLTWIVSLDSDDPAIYARLRGEGYAEAHAFAERLLALFPRDAYVQALRIADGEEDIEKFYRAWKAKTPNVIVQKHDDFCAFMPQLRATDLSPVKRFPCRHLMRDLSVLIDGTVPVCREDVRLTAPLGNAFSEPLSEIWGRARGRYADHCAGNYPDICASCDEYYTYNF